MSTKHKCPATVHSGIWSRGHACGVTAAHEHEGVFFCKTHHPPTIRAKRDAQSAKWRAEMDAKSAVRKAGYERQAEMERNAARYEFLRERLLGADFDWQESGESALVFSWPDAPVSADCDATIDAGIQAVEKAKEEA